jgi:hypothetical protein
MVCELSCQYLGANPCRVTLPPAGQSASVQLGRRSGNDGGSKDLSVAERDLMGGKMNMFPCD